MTSHQPELPAEPQSRPLASHGFDVDAIPEFLTSGFLLSLDADRLLIGWGKWRDCQAPTAENPCALFTTDFYLDAPTWRATAHWAVVERGALVGVLKERSVNFKGERFRWVEPDLATFSRAWEEIQSGFRERGLKKAVPVVYATTRGRIEEARLSQILHQLLMLPSALWLYGAWSGERGHLGATPEILFSRTKQGFSTMALAGTRAFDVDAAALLLADPKERYEHQLVVDDIVERLSKVGDVAVGTTGILQLPTLLHLQTLIRCRGGREFGFDELVRLLHPTPALGVAPRALGFSEIRRWDQAGERGPFGAPFGAAVFGGPAQCVVAIRGIEWNGDEVRLGSGCGVVPESELDREWRELALKRASVRRMLAV